MRFTNDGELHALAASKSVIFGELALGDIALNIAKRGGV